MSTTKIIRFRVDSQQLQRIEENARMSGYGSLASYLRSASLARIPSLEQKLNETNKLLRKILEVL